MYFEEMNMEGKVRGNIVLVIDIYKRGMTLEGLGPWYMSNRMAVNANNESWIWYWDGEEWRYQEHVEGDRLALALDDLLGTSGPATSRAEINTYQPNRVR